MAQKVYRVRNVSVFNNSGKIGTQESGSLKLVGNDESMFVDGGWGGMTDGAIQSTLSMDMISPVTGENQTLLLALLNKDYVRIECAPIDGVILSMVMRITDESWDWVSKTGSTKSKISLEGGKPELV